MVLSLPKGFICQIGSGITLHARLLEWVDLGLVDRSAESSGLPFVWKEQPSLPVSEAPLCIPDDYIPSLFFSIHPFLMSQLSLGWGRRFGSQLPPMDLCTLIC